MQILKAKDVYLALLQVEFRFGTSITQVFTDGGSQLKYNLLGEQKDFYQRKLGRFFGMFNNKAYSQQRNFCERKVQSAKKVIKQSLQSRPGPQDEP